MDNSETIALDSTVRSQDSGKTNNSKDSTNSKDSKPDSCQESKHSKEILISERQQRQQQHHAHQQQQQQILRDQEQRQKLQRAQARDDTNILMFTSCGQLLLGEFESTNHSVKSLTVLFRTRNCIFVTFINVHSRGFCHPREDHDALFIFVTPFVLSPFDPLKVIRERNNFFPRDKCSILNTILNN